MFQEFFIFGGTLKKEEIFHNINGLNLGPYRSIYIDHENNYFSVQLRIKIHELNILILTTGNLKLSFGALVYFSISTGGYSFGSNILLANLQFSIHLADTSGMLRSIALSYVLR